MHSGQRCVTNSWHKVVVVSYQSGVCILLQFSADGSHLQVCPFVYNSQTQPNFEHGHCIIYYRICMVHGRKAHILSIGIVPLGVTMSTLFASVLNLGQVCSHVSCWWRKPRILLVSIYVTMMTLWWFRTPPSNHPAHPPWKMFSCVKPTLPLIQPYALLTPSIFCWRETMQGSISMYKRTSTPCAVDHSYHAHSVAKYKTKGGGGRESFHSSLSSKLRCQGRKYWYCACS